MTPHVVIDPARREMSIGEMVLPIDLRASDGSVQALPPAGPTLRPVTFGERYRLVELAAASPDPAGSLRRALFDCACMTPASAELDAGELAACEALALHLAGAGIDAPPFADTMILLAGSAGWGYHEIEEAEAARADRLARRLRPAAQADDDGWNRFVFAPPAPLDLESMVREMLVSLLDRYDDPVTLAAAGEPADRPATFGSPTRSASQRDPGSDASESEGEAMKSDAMMMGGARNTPAIPTRDDDASPREHSAMRGEPMGSRMPTADPARRSKVLGYELDWRKRPRSAGGDEARGDDRAMGMSGRNASVPQPSATNVSTRAADAGGPSGEPAVRLLRGSFGGRRAGDDVRDRARTDDRAVTPAMPAPRREANVEQARPGGIPATATTTAEAMRSERSDITSRPAGLRAIEGARAGNTGGGVSPATTRREMSREAHADHHTGAPMPALDAEQRRRDRSSATWRREDAANGQQPSPWGSREDDAARWSAPAAAIAAMPGTPAEGSMPSAALMEIADALAAMLDDEADLRGLDR